MDSLIEVWDDILHNLQMLEDYKKSPNEEEKDFFKQIVRDGTCFIVYNLKGRLVFAPSKFLGYKNNNYEKHQKLREQRDGRDTNHCIEKIVNIKFAARAEYEREYLKYCKEHDITPKKTGAFGAPRKYIFVA